MKVKVFFPNKWDDEWFAHLGENLHEDVEILIGPDLPDPADYNIIVSGRPKKEDLQASPKLAAMIIPWSGVPKGTKELLEEFPRVALHNIHHNAVAVAEMAVAHLLSVAKEIVPHHRALRKGDWGPRYEGHSAFLLRDKTALILGYGAVGRLVGKALKSFSMNILGVSRSQEGEGEDEVARLFGPDRLHDLLPKAQVLMVCLPHTDETTGCLGAEELGLLPEGAIVVNIGRGHIIDQEALYEALSAKRLYGAGLDVWYNYPRSKEAVSSTYPGDFPFHELDNIVMSPHRAGHVQEDGMLRTEHLAVLLNAAARGEEMPNKVDVNLGY